MSLHIRTAPAFSITSSFLVTCGGDNDDRLSALNGLSDEDQVNDDWRAALDGLDGDDYNAEAGRVYGEDWGAQLDNISVASSSVDNMSVGSPQVDLVEVPVVELHDITRIVHASNCTPDDELDESARTVAEY
eukprot:2201015-Pyramimonas_sp.AAC.1